MDTAILDYVLAKLEAAKGTWPDIAEETGVPYDTIAKIFQRQIVDPKISKVQLLYNHFRAREQAVA
jgi:predicted transcriptional regulator